MSNSKKNNVDVSIVIVCMNNLTVLLPCLDSIRKYTVKYSYEVFVVSYLCNKEYFRILHDNYSWVKIIESNEIRGFSENNNLAFKKMSGKYCFVLNDDTFFTTPVLDALVDSMLLTPDAAIMSPSLFFPDGRPQFCGRPPMNIWNYVLSMLKIWKEQKVVSKYTNKAGIFQSYNIIGAAFLIKSDIFENLGYFDEKFFFGPEDLALSTLANKLGYKCFVNSSISIYHVQGQSFSRTVTATMPAHRIGNILFYADDSFLKHIFLNTFIVGELLLKWFPFKVKALMGSEFAKYKSIGCINSICSILKGRTPKEAFIYYYKQKK